MPRLALAAPALAAVSGALLGAYAIVALATGAEPWPLGGGAVHAAGAVSLTLGLALGWAVPGLSLACLWGDPPGGAALLGRALGLGCGYLLGATALGGLLLGHSPSPATWLVLLALPSVALAAAPVRRRSIPAGPVVVAIAAVAVLAVGLWPKLHREALNGDGTEAFELGRSLLSHPLPRWDLERDGGAGGFGTPAVNPFVTNSALVAAGMRLLGPGELAARLPMVPALVIGLALSTGLARRVGWSGWAYALAVAAAYLVWNCYYVGYEPAFTDLAEPAATDTLMIALWLSAFVELTGGSLALGTAFLLLASGVLYSAPLLAALALAALAAQGSPRAWPALRAATLAGLLVLGGALAYGGAAGLLADWGSRLRAEYWSDFVGGGAPAVPGAQMLVPLALATGLLPLAALARYRRLDLAQRTLLLTAASYLAVVLAHSYKNLHYLAPLPLLLVPPALAASGPRLRVAAAIVALAGVVASWPSDRAVHTESRELGRGTWIDGPDYEAACLAGDTVYQAFDRPGAEASRFAVGKHTLVRYALELGGPQAWLRLSPSPREGWLAVATGELAVWVKDLDVYAGWRLRVPRRPSSWLFRRPALPALPLLAEEWRGRVVDLTVPPGHALLIEDFEPPRSTARLLSPRGPARLRLAAGALAAARINGAPADLVRRDAGLFELSSPAWRAGWNLLEVDAEQGEAVRLTGLETP